MDCEKCMALNTMPTDDAERIGQEPEWVDSCLLYPNGIPPEILSGGKTCEAFLKKEE